MPRAKPPTAAPPTSVREQPMTDHDTNSGSPLAGDVPAIAVPESDTATDAAAWARIDRALISTRKWLWVFVIFGCLFSAGASLLAIAVAVTWPAVESSRSLVDMSTREIVLELLMLGCLVVWALAALVATVGLLHWARAGRRQPTVRDLRSLVMGFQRQQLAWTAIVATSACGVAYMTLVLLALVTDPRWLNG